MTGLPDPRSLHVCGPATGHFLPLVPLASAFRDRGDEVAVATAASFAPRVEGAGLPALPAGIDQSALDALFAPHGAEIAALPALARRRYVFSRRWALIDSPARVDDLRRHAESWQPDLLVHESAELAGPLVATALGIPSAHHSFGRMVPWAAIDEAARIAAPMWENAGVAPEPFAGMFSGAYIDVCPPRSSPTGRRRRHRCCRFASWMLNHARRRSGHSST
jgi:Glycosyl transferases, related to UDP-glucuronosyltransferase